MIKYFIIHRNELTSDMVEKSTKTFETTPLLGDYYVVASANPLDATYKDFKQLSRDELRDLLPKLALDTITDTSRKTIVDSLSPFASKFYKGYKIYGHMFGTDKYVLANETETLRIKVPFDVCFFTEAELVNASRGATVNFKFQIDNGEGGFTTIFQHGHNVSVRPDFYRRKSRYEAELNSEIYVCAEVTNGDEDRKIGFNINIHEARS